jgi:hypothetical protein
MRVFFRVLIFFFTVITLFSTCKLDREPEWNTQILLPVINTSLDIGDLVDDSIISTNADSSLILVYRYVFNSLSLDTMLKIPDTTLQKTVTLKSIKLGKRVINQKITLGEIARKNGMMLPQGFSVPIPPISNINAGAVDLDATDLFESVDVLEGEMTAEIKNELPIELTDVIFALRNKISNTLIIQDTIQNVAPKENILRNYSLDGKTFEGNLSAELINISSPGSGSSTVKIDTNDALNITVTVDIGQVSRARAIFPSQNLIDHHDDVEYNLNGPELKFMRVKSGKLKVIVASTLQDTGYVTYSIDAATYKGVDPLIMDVKLPPAEDGDTVYIEKVFDVDDYWFDLTGEDGTKVNSFFNSLIMRLDSTGKMVELSLDDSIYIYYTLYDVIPEYVEGYLGQEAFNFAATTDELKVLSNLTEGKIDFEDLELSFFAENGVGADARVVINELRATNTRNGNKVQLNTPLIEINIDRAMNNPLVNSYSKKTIDGSNSNIDELFEIFPNEFYYDFSVSLNPNGNANNYQDFIYHESKLNAGIEVEMPLQLSAKNLTLIDTLDFNLGDISVLDQTKEAVFKIISENSFPLEADIQLFFIEQSLNKVVDSMFSEKHIISAGIINPGKERVLLPSETIIEEKVWEERLTRMKYADKIIVVAKFNSLPEGQQVKIYSDYELKVKLVTDVTYQTKF